MATHRWYTALIATSHPRIQVTEDPELTRALHSAASHLPSGLSRSRQVRDLAIVGAQHLAEARVVSEERRHELLERLASYFEHPETAPWDSELLNDVKRRAWRLEP